MNRPSRITVVETVAHQPGEGQPTSSESRFTRPLRSNEEVWRKTLKVSEEWVKVEWGWVEKVGMLVIHNEEGKNRQVYPTDDEAKTQASRIIEIATQRQEYQIIQAFAQVFPGESSRFHPVKDIDYYVRCKSGQVRCLLIVFPG